MMKLATVTVIALMLGAAPVLADDERPRGAPMMPAFDFSEADADGNGSITREEWTAYVTDRMQSRRAEMIDRRVDQMIEAGDTDGDGLLSRTELVTLMETRHSAQRERMGERAEERAERRAERGERQGRGHGPRGYHQRMMAPEDFAERSFSRIDANDDGMISAEEFETAQARWQERAGRRRGVQSD